MQKKSRWAWIVCTLLFLGFLGNSIGDYLVARNNVRKTITESTLPLTSDNVYSEIQRDLLRPIFISSLMSTDTFLRDWVIEGEQNQTHIVRFLNEIKVRYGTVTSFFVSEKTHNYYHADGLLKTISEDDPRDEWYYRVREMDDSYEINVDLDMANQDEMTIFINYRVKDYAGEFIGTTGVGLTVDNVNKLISNYERKYKRQIYFVDEQGKIVLRPSNSPMLSYTNLQEIDGLSEKVGELLSGEMQSLTYEREGEYRIMNCRFVPELDWYLIVEQSEEAMLAPLRSQFYTNILIAFGMTALIGGICIVVIRSHKAGIEMQNQELKRKAKIIEGQQKALQQKADEVQTVNKKLQELNHEKDEFLGIVAHDLRNPLSSIIGLSSIIKEDLPEGSDSLEALTDIQICGNAMLELTRSLLDVSRIEANHGFFQTQPVEWNLLLQSVAMQFSANANKKQIRMTFDLSDTEETVVDGVEEWMVVILNNLLSNALKYTPEYGKVSIRTIRTETHIETWITDSGPGIKSEEQHKLFQKFVRLSTKPTGNEHSTGLGLYTVKKMCDRLGIGIRIESQWGKGATFILEQEI